MDRLEGRVVATQGIGREHALPVSSEGANVVVNNLGSGPAGCGSESNDDGRARGYIQ